MEQAKLVAIFLVAVITVVLAVIGFAAVTNYRHQNPGVKTWPNTVVIATILSVLDAGIILFCFRALAH